MGWGLPSLASIGRGRSRSKASSTASTQRLTGCSAPRALHSWEAWLWAERGREGSAMPICHHDWGLGCLEWGPGWVLSHTWQGGRPRDGSGCLQVGAQGVRVAQVCVAGGTQEMGPANPGPCRRVSSLSGYLLQAPFTPVADSDSVCDLQWLPSSGRTCPAGSQSCYLLTSALCPLVPVCPPCRPASGPPHILLFIVFGARLLTGLVPLSLYGWHKVSSSWKPALTTFS